MTTRTRVTTGRWRWAFLVFLCWQSACAVQFIAGYDETFDRSATTLQHQMDSALTALGAMDASADAGSFTRTLPFYQAYGTDLRTLLVRAQSLPKNEHTAAQVSAILASLDELSTFHQQQGHLSPGYAAHVRDEFNQSWRAVLTLELAKKR